MLPRPFSTVALVAAMAVLAGACGGDSPPAPTTTTGTALPTRTTITPLITIAPGATTTTTTPAQIATSVDACGLVEPAEVALVVDDAGPGVAVDTPMGDEEAGIGSGMTDRDATTAPPPAPGAIPTTTTTPADGDDEESSLLLSGCTWPSEGPGEVTLTYLAPTTATSAREHLQRLIDLGTRFARGGRVLPLNPNGDLVPAALIDGDGKVLEVAVVTGSALVYVAPVDPPAGNSREANALLTLLLAAGRRAPG